MLVVCPTGVSVDFTWWRGWFTWFWLFSLVWSGLIVQILREATLRVTEHFDGPVSTLAKKRKDYPKSSQYVDTTRYGQASLILLATTAKGQPAKKNT